jgi:hypothetical protein
LGLLLSLELLVKLPKAWRSVMVRIATTGDHLRRGDYERACRLARRLAAALMIVVDHFAWRRKGGIVELEIQKHGRSPSAGRGGLIVSREGAARGACRQEVSLKFGVSGELVRTLRRLMLKPGVQRSSGLKRGGQGPRRASRRLGPRGGRISEIG